MSTGSLRVCLEQTLSARVNFVEHHAQVSDSRKMLIDHLLTSLPSTEGNHLEVDGETDECFVTGMMDMFSVGTTSRVVDRKKDQSFHHRERLHERNHIQASIYINDKRLRSMRIAHGERETSSKTITGDVFSRSARLRIVNFLQAP